MISVPPFGTPILNPTMRKFGAPEPIIHQFQHWSVMLRPIQLTLVRWFLLRMSQPVPSLNSARKALPSFTE